MVGSRWLLQKSLDLSSFVSRQTGLEQDSVEFNAKERENLAWAERFVQGNGNTQTAEAVDIDGELFCGNR